MKLRSVLLQTARKMATAAPESAVTDGKQVAEGASRRMRFPYTFSAKIAQFPYRFYYERSPLIPYIVAAFFLSQPIFWGFHKLARSPENIKKWDDIHEHMRNHPKPWEQD